ncbi:MAG: diguanylate cyclase [Deltaproteobacteria bacterium]|nr:diguanylate cyclase [Deltaproteobacteria bacterium]
MKRLRVPAIPLAAVALYTAAAVLLAKGWIAPSRPGVPALLVGAAAALIVAGRLYGPRKIDALQGSIVASVYFLVIWWTGGVAASPLAPGLLLLLAGMSMAISPLAATVAGLSVAGLDAVERFGSGAFPAELDRFVGRLLFILIATAGLGALLRFERRRREHLEGIVQSLRQGREALVKGSLLDEAPEAEGIESRLAGDISGLSRDLEESLYSICDRVGRLLKSRTIALYLKAPGGDTLRLREAVSVVDIDPSKEVRPGDGPVGWVLQYGKPLRVGAQELARIPLPYYAGKTPCGSFAAVPVLDGDTVCGVIAADAVEPDTFGEDDQKILELGAAQVMEVIGSAQALRKVMEQKREFEGLYRFSTALGSTIQEGELAVRLEAAIREIIPADLFILALRREPDGILEIVHAAGAAGLGSLKVEPQSRLGWIAETGHTLAYSRKSGVDPSQPLAFRREKLPSCEVLVGVPLPTPHGVGGVLVAGCRNRDRLKPYEVHLVEVLGRQAAYAFENARLYKRMEQLATTDGLTGLCNHRHFQERITVELERAQRSAQPLSLILLDIDHFKKVNDTYGHPCGDEAIRRLAAVLRNQARQIDLAARYGGEEFVLLLPDTPASGAKAVAERIRNEFQKETFYGPGGEAFQATVSLGLAVYPRDAKKKADIIDRADKALYHAKRTGRNRLVEYGAIEALTDAPAALGLVAAPQARAR